MSLVNFELKDRMRAQHELFMKTLTTVQRRKFMTIRVFCGDVSRGIRKGWRARPKLWVDAEGRSYRPRKQSLFITRSKKGKIAWTRSAQC